MNFCCAQVNKQCQAAQISGSVKLMNHLALRQTLNSEDKTSETLSCAEACPESQMRWFPERADSMDAGGRFNMALESKSEHVCVHTQLLFSSGMMLESERLSSDPNPFVALCV